MLILNPAAARSLAPARSSASIFAGIILPSGQRLDNAAEIQPQVFQDHLHRISSGRHRHTGTGVTAGTGQVDIRDWSLVLAELGNWAQRTVLIREKRALSERATNCTDDFSRDVDWGMCDALKNFGLQVRNVVSSNEVDKVISVRFSRVVPGTRRNSPSRVAGDNVGDTENNEFHQRLAGWYPTGVYGGIIPTHDHRR